MTVVARMAGRRSASGHRVRARLTASARSRQIQRSFAATRPEVHVGYDATKAGIVALTRTLAVEWAARGVRVNAVAPGYTDTELLRDVGSESPETLAAWIEQTPQRRLMDPREIAAVVRFLSSPASAAITGQTIVADGGYLAAK